MLWTFFDANVDAVAFEHNERTDVGWKRIRGEKAPIKKHVEEHGCVVLIDVGIRICILRSGAGGQRVIAPQLLEGPQKGFGSFDRKGTLFRQPSSRISGAGTKFIREPASNLVGHFPTGIEDLGLEPTPEVSERKVVVSTEKCIRWAERAKQVAATLGELFFVLRRHGIDPAVEKRLNQERVDVSASQAAVVDLHFGRPRLAADDFLGSRIVIVVVRTALRIGNDGGYG